jgi:long-chain acyl-CoA synthetase
MWMALNLYDVFAEVARRQPDSPAILGPAPDEVLTYRRLGDAIAAVAARLERAGVGPGACVGIHCPSGVGCIVHTYAVWRCGGCAVPIPVELAAVEKQELLRTIALNFVISEEEADSFLEPFGRGPRRELSPGVGIVRVGGRPEHPDGFEDINSAFIRFTSGTTGASKGVVLSHETILERIRAANTALMIGPGDRVVWLLSMAYHFAVSIVGYLSHGAAIVLPANRLAPAILDAAARHRGTLIYGSPTHYAWLAAVPQPPKLPVLRLAVSTTAPLDAALARRFATCFGLPLTQALGIIEVGLPFINTAFAADRPEAVGRVLPAYRLRMEDLGLAGGLGEVLLAGPGFLDAYYDPWQPRAEVMPGGWFRTGDIGELNADGCLFLRGRTKDVISVLGMKFFPQEVEAVLTAHPAVAAACVYAQPDARLGEVPCARVVAVTGTTPALQAELLQHCQRRLAGFKVPQRIEFVSKLERTASGKLIRREAIQRAEAERDQSEAMPT